MNYPLHKLLLSHHHLILLLPLSCRQRCSDKPPPKKSQSRCIYPDDGGRLERKLRSTGQGECLVDLQNDFLKVKTVATI